MYDRIDLWRYRLAPNGIESESGVASERAA